MCLTIMSFCYGIQLHECCEVDFSMAPASCLMATAGRVLPLRRSETCRSARFHRIADPRYTAIFSIGGFREKLRIAGVGHEET